ncbi:MAG: AAA family ATPase [Desulfosarcinaceae bacterium]|nr:AAA family ATPase [Desulfosarcinaceae bacterium]
MIVVCQHCETRYSVADEKVKGNRFLARCTRCGNIFSAYRPVSVQQIEFLDFAGAKAAKRANIIAVSNQKGGVAKTSTTLNLGAALAATGHKVLLVDFDIQANLSLSLGVREGRSFYDVVQDREPSLDASVRPTRVPRLALLPSNKGMILLNKKYFHAENFEYMLIDRLQSITDQYDHILIDTPPSVDLFTLNALTAAGHVIIPCQCDFLSTHGVDQILRLIKMIRGKTNPWIQAQVLITMFDDASDASNMISQKIQGMYPTQTFVGRIPYDNKVKEAQIMGKPVMHYDPDSKAGQAYTQLAQEVRKRMPLAAVI